MIKKLFQNQQEKVKTGSWLLSQNKILYPLFYLLVLFLPTQFGKHFWPNFSFVFGLRLDYLSPTVYLTDIFILLIFLFYFPKLTLLIKKTNKKYLFIFGLFLLSITIGVMGSKNPLAGLYGVIKFLEFSFLTLFVANNFKIFNKKIIFFVFLTGIVFESLLALFQYLNQSSIGGIFYFLGERAFNAQTPGIANASINGQLFLRPYATFSHPNVLAGFVVIAMLYLLLFFKNKMQIYLLAGIFLGTMSLLLTLSRTAIFLWIIYLIVLFGISFVKKYKNRFSNPKLFVGTTIILVLIIFLYFIFQNSFLLQRFSLTKISDESLVQRKELISQSFLMIEKNPVFGVGINNFFNNLNFSNVQLKTSLVQPVHNIFLLVFSETGLIGLIFFVYLSYKTTIVIIHRSSKRERKYLLLLVSSIIFLGFFDHYFLTIQQGQILLSIILGTTLSCQRA
jgi:O-antigen ligase